MAIEFLRATGALTRSILEGELNREISLTYMQSKKNKGRWQIERRELRGPCDRQPAQVEGNSFLNAVMVPEWTWTMTSRPYTISGSRYTIR